MPQTNNGSTDNANISLTADGSYMFYFDDPMNMLINLNNSSGVVIDGSAYNDKINLNNSTNLIIQGNAGNDIFAIAAGATGMNGNVIKGQQGYNFITAAGPNTDIDLTNSTGITAVVSKNGQAGQSLEFSMSQFSGSAVHGTGNNRAFAAVLGTTGVVNLTAAPNGSFVGVINAAGAGFAADGSAITGSALSDLVSEVTSDANITGNLASLFAANYNGSFSGTESEIKDLNAYVFQQGTTFYTLWSDGTVNVNATALYNPGQAAPASFTYTSANMFNNTLPWAGANVYNDLKGNPDLVMFHGGSNGSSAINLTGGVAGIDVHGDSGPHGTANFGLGGSGGNNQVYAPIAGATFDLQNSTALADVLHGSVNGFDMVKIGPMGGDVDLTAHNATTATAAHYIDAVVGSTAATLAGTPESAEIDATTLRTVKVGGVASAVFEAFLGSATDTLTLSASNGTWVQMSQFAPGSVLPANASPLSNAAALDALFGGGASHTAENSLEGYLFEKVAGNGHVLEYLTVYTDATLIDTMKAPLAPLAVHADFHFA